MDPVPKNPIIASFFNQIGNADELGSGTRNLYKYSKRYSGKDPKLVEGDIFRIIVPLNDAYSFDAGISDGFIYKVGEKAGEKNKGSKYEDLTENQKLIIKYLRQDPKLSAVSLAEKVGISARKVENNIKKLKEKGLLIRQGSPKKGYWIIVC